MATTTSDFDFRRPNKLGRDIARGMDLLHEVFARRVGTMWGAELRAYVQVESAGLVQLPYDDVIRSMPNPNVLVIAEPYPLNSPFVVELDLQLGMMLVDRLLGSDDANALRGVRRPTEVELELLGHLGQQAVLSLSEVLAPVGVTEPRMRTVEVNPQLVQVAAPSDPALLVVFHVRVSGPLEAAGTVSMIYPAALMSALLEHVASLRAETVERQIDLDETNALLSGLGAAEVDLAVRLHESSVAASEIRALAVGQVLRLDHRVGIDLPLQQKLTLAESRGNIVIRVFRRPGTQQDLDLLADVAMDVTVELGQVRMRVSDLLRLGEGTVVELDRPVTAPVDVLVNGSLVARGDVVVVGDELGVRVTEIVRRGGI